MLNFLNVIVFVLAMAKLYFALGYWRLLRYTAKKKKNAKLAIFERAPLVSIIILSHTRLIRLRAGNNKA